MALYMARDKNCAALNMTKRIASAFPEGKFGMIIKWNDCLSNLSLRRVAILLVWAFVWGLVFMGCVWAALAIRFDASRLWWLAGSLSLSFAAGCVALLVLLRPLSRALLAVLGLLLFVVIWWVLIPPRNDRDWSSEVARPAWAVIEGDRLTIENVRNFEYRDETDFIERWETRTYDLSRLEGVDLFVCNWGPSLIVHTIASWEFSEGPPLAISIETRKEKGEAYSAVRGLFRQFELYYVVADERDVIGLRSNYRGERVYLYRLRLSPEGARAVLLDYLSAVNQLARHPRWYNAITHNCTTTIRQHALHVGQGNPWDWRILVNGRIDQLGYDRGNIDTSLPFTEIKARSEVTEKARASGIDANFSSRIREGLPERLLDPSIPKGSP
jgi:hypothetical protein